MPHQITTTTTVYSLTELAEESPEGYRTALANFRERAEQDWSEIDYPELLAEFLLENEQPHLTARLDLDSNNAIAEGHLLVPAGMSQRWAEEDDIENEQIPVGEFRDWTGWNYYVGGEKYSWIPDEDGEALLAQTRALMGDLVKRANESLSGATKEEVLVDVARRQGLLFHLDGRQAGYRVDLE